VARRKRSPALEAPAAECLGRGRIKELVTCATPHLDCGDSAGGTINANDKVATATDVLLPSVRRILRLWSICGEVRNIGLQRSNRLRECARNAQQKNENYARHRPNENKISHRW
jgi:hypothetical protein